ncbi:hypothetical protein GCM10020000_65040 [Streptomyces olivoverticillatus]
MRHERRTERGGDHGGATTGSSHTGDASPGAMRCRVTIRYGMAAVAARPTTVPATHRVASTATAALSPTTAEPTESVAPPTASRAMARQP